MHRQSTFIKLYKSISKEDKNCAALIDYFLYDEELPNPLKTFKKEIDNFYYRS